MKKTIMIFLLSAISLQAQSFDEIKGSFDENWKCAAIGVAAGVAGTKTYDVYLGKDKRLQECSQIKNKEQRLACYDKEVKK